MLCSHLACSAEQVTGASVQDTLSGRIDLWDFSAQLISLSGGQFLTVIGVYLICGVGISGLNIWCMSLYTTTLNKNQGETLDIMIT